MSPEKAMRCQEYQWRCKDCRICRIEKCGTYVSGPNGDAPGTTCDDCDRAIHYACHESNRKPKFIKCKKCKAEVIFKKMLNLYPKNMFFRKTAEAEKLKQRQN